MERLEGICHIHIAGLGVKTVDLGWIGAPITRAPRSDFMKSLISSIEAYRGISLLRIQHSLGFVTGMLAEDMPGNNLAEKLKIQKKKEYVCTLVASKRHK